jgi:hypothetical protein
MIYFYGVNIINYINKKKGVNMKKVILFHLILAIFICFIYGGFNIINIFIGLFLSLNFSIITLYFID